MDIQITRSLTIPSRELEFRFTASGGPGGQNVNKVATRVELLFDVLASQSLTDQQRAIILGRLRNQISGEGLFRVVSQETRSQGRNREIAIERFRQLLRDALHVPKARRATKPTRASKEKRLAQKKRHQEIKKQRRKSNWRDE